MDAQLADRAAVAAADEPQQAKEEPSLIGQFDELSVAADEKDAGRLFASDFTDEDLVFVDPDHPLAVPNTQPGSSFSSAAASSFSAAPSVFGSTFDAQRVRAQQQQPPPTLSIMESLVSDAALGLTPAAAPAAAPTPALALSSSSASSSGLSLSSASQPLLILDGPNLAMRHGAGKLFSVRGIELALDWFSSPAHGGFRCLVFLPDFCLDLQLIGERRRAAKAGFGVSAARMPDNVALLRAWRDEGRLCTTPSHDYDDAYAVDYARRHPNALVLSNDQYRDHAQAHGETPQQQRDIMHWLRGHVVSFTFVHDQLVINPEWKIDPVVGLRRIVKQQPYHHAANHAAAASRPQPQQSAPTPAYRLLR